METATAVSKPEPQYQGVGRLGQRALMQKWFQSITEAPEAGRKVVWSFVAAGPFELLRSFDVVDFVFPEIQALQAATKGIAPKYLAIAEEDLGYSLDICGYLKVDLGLIHSGMMHPLGKVPPPDLIMCSTNCNTFIKWAEIWQKYYDVPLLLMDVPMRVTDRESYWGGETFKADKDYMLKQIQDLIVVLEKMTGKKLDLDRVAELEGKWNRVVDYWPEVIQYNKHVPAAFDAYRDGLYYMGALQATRGTDDALPFLREAKKELQERVDLGLYPRPNEQFRMGVHFAPCWCNVKEWFGLFDKWNVVNAWGAYMNYMAEFRHDPSRPLETLAENLLWVNHPSCSSRSLLTAIRKAAVDFHLDGMIFQGIKSCRLMSTPMLHYKMKLQEEGIPALFLEGDIVDPRYFSGAQCRNRVDAFFEALRHKSMVSPRS